MVSDTVALERPSADGVYPQPFFHQRLDEEAHRASRMHAILTLVLIQGDISEIAHVLRAGIRRMDVLGRYKDCLAVLFSEIPREEISPSFSERLLQQAEGVLRIAGLVDADWQEIFLGGCLMPEQKGGRIEAAQALAFAEKALAESATLHQPVLYHGPRRFIETPPKEHHTALVRYGDLHLNKEDQKAWVGSDSVELLPKELELLVYMLKHEGKLIKRDNLCKAVWGYDYYGTTRTVDMHIAKLRKKLKPSRSISIKTLKGEGYRLEINS